MLVSICDLAQDASVEDYVLMHSRGKKSLVLGPAAGQVLDEAIKVLQTVPRWKEAFPTEVIQKRIIDSIFDSETDDEAVDRLTKGLEGDCAEIKAYVAFSGFHIPPEAKIRFGEHSLSVLGEARFEEEVIGRLDQHLAASPQAEEESAKERARHRETLKKYPNVPILVVQYYGSIDGARDHIEPIANRVALFMQFCIGALTDRHFDNPPIVDYRGRFSGDFMALMPVMTVEFGSLTFPNLRGNPWGCTITADNLKVLVDMGILGLADDFLAPHGADDAIDSLLVRAMCAFAEGERAIGLLTRISAYVTSAEILFSRQGLVTKTVTTGLAAATARNKDEFEKTLDLARFIYRQRSDAVHRGIEPTATFVARKLALEAILGMIKLRESLTNREHIQKWLDKHMTDVETECPRCGALIVPE